MGWVLFSEVWGGGGFAISSQPAWLVKHNVYSVAARGGNCSVTEHAEGGVRRWWVQLLGGKHKTVLWYCERL